MKTTILFCLPGLVYQAGNSVPSADLKNTSSAG